MGSNPIPASNKFIMILEEGKCYVELKNNTVVNVFKVYASDFTRFKELIKCESIGLSNHHMGLYEISYMSRDQDRQYYEISEEDFQKFMHLHNVYIESLTSLKNKIYGNIRNEGGLG